MKNIKSLLLAFMFLFAMPLAFTSCDKDKGEAAGDAATQIEGVYTGKLVYNNTVVEDAYVVRVSRISSSVVYVSANFFGDSGGANFNVTQSNGQYILKSETEYNINITVVGKSMAISYMTVMGLMYNFNGSRD